MAKPNTQQGGEKQEREEMEEAQLQLRWDQPLGENNLEDKVEKESLPPSHIGSDQELLLYVRSENTRNPQSCWFDDYPSSD